jgi:DNA-binding MarR family transcriptional regulator
MRVATSSGSMAIDDEIQQTVWKSPYQKAVVNTMFTSRVIEEQAARRLKPYDITTPQFNILRILRGQKGKPASVKLLVERMLDKSSNASRLVDKLLEKGYVQRTTCPDDRRAVEVRITDSGMALLSSIDEQTETSDSKLTGFSAEDATRLSSLLDKLRAAMRESEKDSRAG